MRNIERFFVKGLTILMFGFSAFVLAGTFMYSLAPDKTIDLQIQTDRTAYMVGDEINTKNTFSATKAGRSKYNSRLVCRNGVERRILLETVEAVTAVRPPGESSAKYTAEGVTGHSCVIEVTAHNCFEVLPLLTKCNTNIFSSNEFALLEK